MFIIDKDMERVMLAKKKEVLQELEEAKKRILHELYCVKRSVHTDFCAMLADYNRIQLDARKLTDGLKEEITKTTNDLRIQFATSINEYTALIDEKITAWEQFETTVTDEINDALLELEALQSQVDTLISTWEQIAADGVTKADLDALKAEMQEAIEGAVSSIDFETFKADVEALIAQGDWDESNSESPAFIRNRTHYRDGNVSTTKYNGIVSDYFSSVGSILVFQTGNARSIKIKYGDEPFVEYYFTDKVNGAYAVYGDYGIIVDDWMCGGAYRVDGGAIQGTYDDIAVCTNKDITVVKSGYSRHEKSDLKIAVEISHGAGGYKTIDPAYIVSNNDSGTLLALIDGKITTVDTPFTSFTELRYVTLIDGMVPFDSEDGTNAIFETTVETGHKLIESGGYEYNYIWASHTNGTTFRGTTLNNINHYFRYNDETGKIIYKIPLTKIVDADYQSSGAYLKVLYPANSIQATVCILTSPNGSRFNVIVSDDGTLSTTPIT